MEDENAIGTLCRLRSQLMSCLERVLNRHAMFQSFYLPPQIDRMHGVDATDETPFLKACREGRVEDVKELIEKKDGSLMELTPEGETPLHLAARNSNFKAVNVLLNHAKLKNHWSSVVNVRNCRGETALHLAASRNDVQVVKLLLEDSTLGGTVEVNAKTNGGFTVLDILDSSSETGEAKQEIEKILQRAGGLRGRCQKVANDRSNQEVPIEVDDQFYRHPPMHSNAHTTRKSVETAHMMLLLATMFATMTFHASLRIDSLLPGETDHLPSLEETMAERRVETVTFVRIFILFNSMAFFSSLGLIAILLHHLPLKPWLITLVASFSGAYICAVMASTSADETMTVVLIGASILTAAMMNCVAFKFNKVALNFLRQICKRYHLIELDWSCRNGSYRLLQELC